MVLMLLAASLTCIFTIRVAWIGYSMDKLVLNSFYWTMKTKQPKQVIGEVTAVWPYSHMVMELWNWSFRRYVVHQDHYDNIKSFTREQSRREHLDMKEFLGPLPPLKRPNRVKDDSDSISEQE